MDTKRLVATYFNEEFTFPEIVLVLASKHRIVLSERTVKRYAQSMNLYRRKFKSDIKDVALFIEETLETSGQLRGYRWMYWKCVKTGYVVSQEDIRHLLQIQDPEGVKRRKARRLKRRVYLNHGPNDVWHLDGYDKLKPYGIAIHGCIDGFSRYIVWLEASRTNNDPAVIACYFLSAIQRVGGVPKKVRADNGTENRHIEQMQLFFRETAGSFVYGCSTHNQRIEGFWGILRKENAQFWMDTFRTIRDELEAFSGDMLDKSLIQFCFLGLIQAELAEIKRVWNSHRIQRNRRSVGITGRPHVLYFAPELFGTVDCKYNVSTEKLRVCSGEVRDLSHSRCDETIQELREILLEENGWELPDCVKNATTLYLNLRTAIHSLL